MTKTAVKRANTKTGHGSNKPNGSEKDVFVHHTALEAENLDRLADGQDVTTEILSAGKGRQSTVEMALA